MKKPINYYGFAFDNCKDGYNKKFLKSMEGRKELKRCKKNKKRLKKHLKKHGFDPSETWNLDYTFARFILPRLKYFRNNLHGYPSDLSMKKWEKILDKIILSFEIIVNDDLLSDTKNIKKVQKGLRLFAKYYLNLWD